MRNVILWMLAALALAACGSPDGPLIERDELFGEPSRTQMRLSPDGTRMSFLAPHQGALNIWVGPAGELESAKPITKAGGRGIKFHMWLEDNQTLLFEEDRTSDENWHIYAINLATGEERDLTPMANVQAKLVGWSRSRPDKIVVGLNDRDPRWHDLYFADLRTGELSLIERNDRFQAFLVDHDLNVRFATRATQDGGLEIFANSNGAWSPAFAVPPEDALNFRFIEFDITNKHVYLLDSRGRETSALLRYTPSTGEFSLIGQTEGADIEDVLLDPKTQQVQAYASSAARREWIVIDRAIEQDFVTVSNAAKGEFLIVDRTDADDRWIVYSDRVTEPGAYFIYDRNAKTVTRAFSTRPELEKTALRPMHVVTIPARDGLDLVGYLTLPRSADRNEDAVADKPVPLALVVHGGPWSRDTYGFEPWHQWLANRGYAALSVNFRGSTGFGKAFLNAGDRQWGAKMQEDLLDAVFWAEAQGIAMPGKTAIMGGSYGGFAALSGLAFTPDRFACGISIVGPPDLSALLKSVPPHWSGLKDIFRRRVGDADSPEGRADLLRRSPISRADDISRPLLISQGAKDPRVRLQDLDLIVRTLREKNVPVTYLLYPDEGHSLGRQANKLAFYAVADGFLAKCLGGRSQPIGKDFSGSSIEVIEGAEQVPGLADAIAALAQGPGGAGGGTHDRRD